MEITGSIEHATRKRMAVIVVAFAVFAAAGAFAWQGFGPSTSPTPATQSDAISSTVLWPERSQAALVAAQASADAGDPATAWRDDPAQVATRFAEDVLGWGPAEGRYLVKVTHADATGAVEARVDQFALPCPSPPPGAVPSCPPPYSDETLTLRQEATTGPNGIWSVTEVRASGLVVDLRPGDQVENGAALTGSVTFPDTAASVPRFSAMGGIHVVVGTRCYQGSGMSMLPGTTSLGSVQVTPDSQSGQDCGPTPGAYVSIETASGEPVVDPLALAPGRTFFGLTLVPVRVLVPENRPSGQTATAGATPSSSAALQRHVDPMGIPIVVDYPQGWSRPQARVFRSRPVVVLPGHRGLCYSSPVMRRITLPMARIAGTF